MADEHYVLSKSDVDVLRQVVAAWRNGTLGRPLQSPHRPLPARTSVIFGVPDASIEGTSDTLSEPHSGTLNVYTLTSTGGTTDSGRDETVFNLSTVARTTGEFVSAVRDDASGQWLMTSGGGGTTYYKHLCRFVLDGAFATSDPSALALLTNQYGEGTAHSTGEITVNNLRTHDEGLYLFAGDSGDAGLAYYDTNAGTSDTSWIILQMECAT